MTVARFDDHVRAALDLPADDPANPAAFKQNTQTVTSKDALNAALSKRGGFVVWLAK